MKKILILIFVFIKLNVSFSQYVDLNLANQIASNFYSVNNQTKEGLCTSEIEIKYNNQIVYYIFNFDESAHVIVPACKSLNPIFTYSFKEKYNSELEDLENYKAFMDNYSKIIFEFINNDTIISENLIKWKILENKNVTKVADIVSPLITTAWGQDKLAGYICPGFNEYVDTQNSECYCNKCTIGCGSVAIAQVMNYWEFCLIDGINFWNWSILIDDILKVGLEQDHVAFFIYNVAKETNMNFCFAGCSSFNTPYNMEDALHNFGYGNAELERRYANLNVWETKIKSNLNNYQPVIYMGFSDGIRGDEDFGSHAFIIDGYDTEGKYHINWGANFHTSAYYDLDHLQFDGYYYNLFQRAIFDIYPTEVNTACNEELEVCLLDYMLYGYKTVPIVDILKTDISSPWESCKTIYFGDDVKFAAYSQIRLRQGFKVENGGKFRAGLTQCPQTRETPQQPENVLLTKTANTSTSEIESNTEFEIFPNPFTGTITINYAVTENAETVIKIYNIFGQLQTTVLSETKEIGEYTLQYDFANLSAGIYMFTMQNGKTIKSEKIVKTE